MATKTKTIKTPVKLYYFDARGRAEIIRLVFAYGKIPFEDVRVEHAQWGAQKKDSPWGSMPILEVNGQKIGQNLAIARYAAREAGLYPDDAFLGARIDEIQCAREDLVAQEFKPAFEKDEKVKGELMEKLTKEIYPRYLGKFNNFITGNKSGWAVGDNVTLADLVIYEGTESLNSVNPKILDDYKGIKALRAKVEALPAIKEYLAKRKPTQF